MAKKNTQAVSLDFAFFVHLHQFYTENRGRIRKHYKELTKKYLDFNDPSNSNSFLRQPQFEALEMYIFLKEYLDNEHVYKIFKEWSEMNARFEGRTQLALFESVNKEQYDRVFNEMKRYVRVYPNYIFALTMGTGKTILMATCIFYEFLLANKFPADPRFCHNALVFAPDTTVLESLREIQTFDMTKVVPPEYVSFLSSNLKYHFLDETGTALSVLDKSRFNIIISNTQKIILKRQSTEKTAMDRLFGSGKPTYEAGSVYDENADLYGFDLPEDESELTTNQRFEKLRRLEQLGIYVDEAHHAFGTNLAKDVGAQEDNRQTSLRLTIDELASSLKKAGTQVVACYNYTGTPYVGNQILPEVVYAFGLTDAINKEYLKKVNIHGYKNVKSTDFITQAIKDFWAQNGDGQRHEGMLPKIAFFASTIDELQKELRPAVEKALVKLGIPTTKILVNVGDEKITSNDDIREFIHLDTSSSEKQFILLVNKGREGWNCRSLFGVGLFRQPKSKIFVLQATMRCLRSIGVGQQTGQVYLSEDNIQILEDELQQNFRVNLDDFRNLGTNKKSYEVRVILPPVKVKLARVRTQFHLKNKPLPQQVDLKLEDVDLEQYVQTHTVYNDLKSFRIATQEKISDSDDRREFSEMTLVAEISRYLNISCLQIEEILSKANKGIEEVIEYINQYNDLLYDWIIPQLFKELYEITEQKQTEEYEIELVKVPLDGHYTVSAADDMVVTKDNIKQKDLVLKSFHLDTYCFDSGPERDLFWSLLRDKRVEKIYFTGMLTHGQSDFFIQYIDPESHSIRSYYPDFLMIKIDGTYVIVEVKGDNMIEDPIVLAKKSFAEQMASASNMTYRVIKGSDANLGRYSPLFSDEVIPYQAEILH
jgi:type III restriction enzyme